MTLRRGFTLIELIVVISVIAVMAGMAVPAIGMVKRKVADMQCGHNLQQIGTAIMAFREGHDDRFPQSLKTPVGPQQEKWTSLVERRDELMAGMDRMFICPRDSTAGMDARLGRPDNWDDLGYLWEPGCSYLYEASTRPVLSENTIRHFLLGYPTNLTPPSPLTWVVAKSIQQRCGNYPTDTTVRTFVNPGSPFPADRFPIVRCFYHYDWDKAVSNYVPGNRNGSSSNPLLVRKVKAVSWNGSLFECSPFWETDIDARFMP